MYLVLPRNDDMRRCMTSLPDESSGFVRTCNGIVSSIVAEHLSILTHSAPTLIAAARVQDVVMRRRIHRGYTEAARKFYLQNAESIFRTK
jgi:hypothetical protein